MKKLTNLFLSLLLVLGLAGGAFGETLTIQPALEDTRMLEVTPNTVYGGGTDLQIASQTAANARTLPAFDFTALPNSAVISSAILSLYYYTYNATDPVGRTYWAYRLTQTTWVESQTTWNNYKTDTPWIAPGGDYTETNGASTTVPVSYGWMSWDVTSIVQYSQVNEGKYTFFLLRDGTESSATTYNAYFHASEYTTDTSLRPKLVITYTVPRPYSYIF